MDEIGRWLPDYPGSFLSVATGRVAGTRYAFLGTDKRLDLFEIADEGPPKPAGVSVELPGQPQQLEWEGEVLVGRISTKESSALYVWNVSNVRRPRQVAFLEDVTVLYDLDGETAYIGRGESPGMEPNWVVRNVSQPEGLLPLGEVGHPFSVKGAGDLAYSTSFKRKEHKYGLSVLKVSDVPRVIGFVEGASGGLLQVSGGNAYVMTAGVGLHVVDVTDPTAPRLVGELAGDPAEIGTSNGIGTPAALLLQGQYLYALAYGGDWGVYRWRLLVVDVSDPAGPRELGSAEGIGEAAGLWLQGHQAVVVDRFGLSVIDVSDPTRPVEVGRVPASADPASVHLVGDYAYLFLRSGLFVLDLSAVPTPQLATFRYFGPIGRAWREGDTFNVSVFTRSQAYEVDVSEPGDPKATETRVAGLPPRPTAGPYTYGTSCGSLHVEDPSKGYGQAGRIHSIVLTDHDCRSRWEKWEVAVAGGHAYVVGGGKLLVMDLSSPAAPAVVWEKVLASGGDDAPQEQASLLIEDGRAYVLHGGLWVLDLSYPAQPREVAYYATDALTLDMEGDRIALVGPDGSFELLKLESP